MPPPEILRDLDLGGPPPERLHNKTPHGRLVVALQARHRIGQSAGGVLLELELTQCEQLARLGALACGLTALPEDGRHDRDACRCRDEGRPSEPASPALPRGAKTRGPRKRVLGGRQPPRVALLPEREVPVGLSRPQQVFGLATVLPRLRRLPQLVPKLRPVGVLRLPSDQTRPAAQQRFVDDLDLLATLSGLISRSLERRQKPRVDEIGEHFVRISSVFLFKDREKVLSLPHRPRPLGRHEIAEELPHQRRPLRPDPLERRLRVLGQ